ncbi:protein extra-macrochaetae-like [Portunus trituberculatus]|uniref:Protein extra-macrochaetae n=1 Tax=Portunus trituberculatus TaxID=210409 RepID=A0A5B7FPM5_PORTR|nr:protein extra-macrochaetae-like [Portunus trituberculatus]MPC47406.1 Protein extra-macrochaetae [Portunus trituberculatus]
MKAQRCSSPLQAVVGVLEGKAGKPSTRAEATQVLMYLDRLQQLVPQCPKDRPVPRLELIQAVIDYICDLQDQLAEAPTLLPETDTLQDSVFEDEPPENSP